jgi:undecaprenyl-diphosphatase
MFPSHLFDGLLKLFLEILASWGYVFLLVITICESLPLLGVVIPGGFIVLAAGFFIKTGVFHWMPTFFVVCIGSIVGNVIGYYIGRKYGESFLLRFGKYIFFQPKHFEKTKVLLHTHPGKAIIGGHFYSLTRALVPFAAGSMGISSLRFFTLTTIGTCLWVGIYIPVGYLFGQGFELASKYLGYIFIGAVVVSIAVVYLYRWVNHFVQKNKHFTDRYQVYPLIANLISIAVFAKILESVTVGEHIIRIDRYSNQFVDTIRFESITTFFIWITNIATPVNLFIISVALTVYFAYKHRWYYELLLPLALIGGTISTILIKYLVEQERPVFSLIRVYDFSFPSGHATLSTIFFLLMIYFFYKKIERRWLRILYVSVNIFALVLVSFSRIYLDVHWLSDVVAGFALGVFWVSLAMILLEVFKVMELRIAQRRTNASTSEKSKEW